MKDLDTFFCTGDFSDFSAAFPTADTADYFFLQGENEWAKQKLFNALCKSAASTRLPYTRVLYAHNAAKTAAVYLSQQHRFAVDADYFPSLLKRHPHAKRYTAPAYVRVSPAAGTEHAALLLRALQAQTRAVTYLRTAADAQKSGAEILTRHADRARILRAVFEVTNAAAPAAEKAYGKILCRRKLSAVTAWGVHTVYEPFQEKDVRTAVLRDAYGGVSPLFLQGLCTACMEIGLDVQLYTDPLSGTLVHLMIPACSTAFFTENDLHPFPFRTSGVIGASRFLNRSAARAVLPELRVCRDTVSNALDCAVFSLYEADEARGAVWQFAETHTDRTALAGTQSDLVADFFSFRHFAE